MTETAPNLENAASVSHLPTHRSRVRTPILQTEPTDVAALDTYRRVKDDKEAEARAEAAKSTARAKARGRGVALALHHLRQDGVILTMVTNEGNTRTIEGKRYYSHDAGDFADLYAAICESNEFQKRGETEQARILRQSVADDFTGKRGYEPDDFKDLSRVVCEAIALEREQAATNV